MISHVGAAITKVLQALLINRQILYGVNSMTPAANLWAVYRWEGAQKLRLKNFFALALLLNGVAGARAVEITRTAEFGDHTYYLASQSPADSGLSWTDGNNFARGVGGDLVTINSSVEQAWIIDTFRPTRNAEFFLWTGLNDTQSEGSFAWSSGEDSAYRNFGPNEPNDFGGGEDYVYLRNFADYKWNDFSDQVIENGPYAFSALVEVPAIRRGVTTYDSFEGDAYTTQVWQGEHVSILTPVNDASQYESRVLLQMAVGLDRGFEYYETMTGRRPVAWDPTTHNGRLTISAVESTCGAACGYLGFNGIEIQNVFFQSFHDGVSGSDQFAQFPFYELGRNFWFYGDQLTTPGSDPMSATTGYAVAMGFLALDSAGVEGGPFREWTYGENKEVIAGLIDTYSADNNLSFFEAFTQGVDFSENQLGGPDLFASLLFKLVEDYGPGFISNVWQEVDRRPTAITDQDAIDNFFLAASYAAATDLGARFVDDWRWPVSPSALAEANLLGLEGDYNDNGAVDGADFLLWQRNRSIGELADWQNNFGTTASPLSASYSVPEPTALLLLFIAALIPFGWRKEFS